MRLTAFLMGLIWTAAAHAAPPNIVFILVDDLGWGDLSCFGQEHWETPRLDQMAEEGMRFTQAYAGSTVCAPSRAALLTGMHTGRGYMRGNGRIALRRDPDDVTIATRLKTLGYETAMIGKSGLACRSGDVDLPNDKGFDHFFGFIDHADAHRHYPTRLVRNGEWVDLPGNEGKTGETYADELFIEDALSWIGERDAAPFFLHLALTPPHADLIVPERYIEPFRGRWEETPHTTSGYYHTTEPKAAYAGMVAFLDEAVGRVLDALAEHGHGEDTVVYFASDNGPHSEGGIDPSEFDSNGPFRGGKRDLYEGGIRTPLIVWWPGTIDSGVVTDQVTAFWDFPATVLELAGGEPIERTSGVSIAPTLLGTPEAQQRHRFLYWEFYEQGGKQAVRYQDWKGVRLNVSENRSGSIEIYDLAADPGETTNVADENPRVVQRMQRIFDYAHHPSAEFVFGAQTEIVSRPVGQRRFSNENDWLVLDRSGFSIAAVSSESAVDGSVAANVIDDDPGTRWMTEWRDAQPTHPHSITIDLGEAYDVSGVRLMARQDAVSHHGTIERVEIRVSDKAEDQVDPVAARLRFTKNEQEVLFQQPVRGRYLTITSLSAFGDSPYASLGNVEVLGER